MKLPTVLLAIAAFNALPLPCDAVPPYPFPPPPAPLPPHPARITPPLYPNPTYTNPYKLNSLPHAFLSFNASDTSHSVTAYKYDSCHGSIRAEIHGLPGAAIHGWETVPKPDGFESEREKVKWEKFGLGPFWRNVSRGGDKESFVRAKDKDMKGEPEGTTSACVIFDQRTKKDQGDTKAVKMRRESTLDPPTVVAVYTNPSCSGPPTILASLSQFESEKCIILKPVFHEKKKLYRSLRTWYGSPSLSPSQYGDTRKISVKERLMEMQAFEYRWPRERKWTPPEGTPRNKGGLEVLAEKMGRMRIWDQGLKHKGGHGYIKEAPENQ